MGTDREAFLHDLPTLVTLLTSEARVHSNNLMSSTCSLGSEDVEERAPTGVENGLRQMMVLDQVEDTHILNHNMMIGFGILPGSLEMVIAALPIDLQMRFSNIASGDASSMAFLLAPGQLALFAAKRSLARAIETRVLDGIAFRVGKEDFQPYINTDVRMLTDDGTMLCVWRYVAGNQRIPVSIGTMHEIDRLGHPDHRAMEFDLEEVTELLGHDQMFVILVQIGVFAILPELDGVPAVRLLEAGEAHIRETKFFRSKEAFEGLGKTISKALHRGRRHMFAPAPFESSVKGILARKCAILLILRTDMREHLVLAMQADAARRG